MYLKPNAPSAATAGKTVIGFNIINGREVEGDLSLIQAKSAVDSRDQVGMFPDSGEKDVARAAKAAADAFPGWSGTPALERGAVIQRTGEILAAQQERFARIITREIGRTGREALEEVQEAIDACRFFASQGCRPCGQALPSALSGQERTIQRRPVGVCGVLTSGTSPLAVPSRKILSAILCGNTVVWKPSDDAPTTAYLFMLALMDAGLPPGVVNTVNGRGRAGCGKHVLAGIGREFYQAFSFAGSTALGRTIGELCGHQLILPSLELGGRNPMVVLPDANLDLAVQAAVCAAFGAAGQRGTSLSNLILHEACAPEFKRQFLEAVEALPAGNPLTDPDVACGPMINARLAEGFRAHWETGHKDGAALLCGGARWTEENRTDRVKGVIGHGLYMQPCVWDGVTPDMGIFQKETPGPTVNLSTVKNFDEAMACVHGAPSGPVASLFTEDRQAIARFKREARAGQLNLNTSATGPREHGVRDFDWHTRWQTVNSIASGPFQPAEPTGGPGKPRPKTDWSSL